MSTHSSSPYRLGCDIRNDTPLTLSLADRKKHWMITGGSGVGKSFAMLHMLKQDIEDPDCGAALLDPHGSMYDLLVHWLSHERPDLADRVVLFDPARDAENILGFNPLGPYAQENPQFALNSFVAACLKGWGQHSTDLSPRITRWLENLIGALISKGLTLAEVGFLLSSRKKNAARSEVLKALDNEFMLEDWLNFEEVNQNQYRDMILEGAQNRLRKFLRNPRLVRVFGQQSRMLNVEQVIEEKKILLVNLRPGLEIEEESCRLLGILLINELYRAALLREPEPVGNPHPFYCYVDEVSSLLTRDLAKALDQTRKYGLFTRNGFQNLEQLREEDGQIYASMLGNCRAKLVFGALSHEDAEILAHELYTDPDATLETKHTNTSVRFRPVEAPDIRYGVSEGENHTDTRSHTNAYGHATAVGQQVSQMLQKSRTETQGEAHQVGSGRTTGVARSNAHQTGTSSAHARSDGSSDGVDLSVSKTHTEGTHQDTSETTSEKNTAATSHSFGAGQKIAIPYGEGQDVLSKSRESSSQHSETKGVDSSRATTTGQNRSDAESKGLTVKRSDQRSETDTHGSLENTTDTTGQTLQASETEMHVKNHTVALGVMEGWSTGTSNTVTDTTQESDMTGVADGTSKNVTVTVGVRNQMQEFHEDTPVFWTPQEVLHRHICHLMNQGEACATVKITNRPPVPIRIDRVHIPAFDREFSPRHLSLFRKDVVFSFPEYYIPLEDGVREIVERQEGLFNRCLSILKPSIPLSPPPPVIEGDLVEASGDDPDADDNGVKDPFS